MFAQRSTRRCTALATVSVLAFGAAAPAQAAPPPIAPASVVPPGRVGRLARITGTVSFHTADADQWSPATLNFPVTSGNAFWTEPGARADLQVAANRITLAPSTELDVATLDDHALAASEPQGATYLTLRTVPAGDSYAVQTPRGTVQITGVGRYEIVAGDSDHPTLVTVVDGAAQVTGANLSLQIGPRQTATITGADTVQGSVGPIAQDAFLTAMLAEERPAARAATPVPAIVQQMTGCEDVDAQGTWQQTPQYGSVWYPPVDPGWVPYRNGRWSYAAPYGWTWVDEASWGFAPFHYGRWAEVDNRWGWIPVSPGGYEGGGGEYAVPAYSPALVSFVDIGAAAVIGGAIGYAAGRSIGWLPLGPREAYYPPYSRDLGYIRRLNATNVQNVQTNITNVSINNRTTVNNFINRGAVTVVPAAAMARSSPIGAIARGLPPGQVANAAAFRAPVTPTAATVGVTPAVARQFNFVPPARPTTATAGPAINPALLRAGPGERPVAPPLRPVGITPELRPAVPPGAVRPETAAPVLRPAEPVRPAPVGRPFTPAPERVAPPLRPQGGAPGAQARLPTVARPPAPAFRPPVVRPPPPAFHPPQPVFRPPQPVFRPPQPVFRPPQPVFRPPQPAFRPPPPPRPAPPHRP